MVCAPLFVAVLACSRPAGGGRSGPTDAPEPRTCALPSSPPAGLVLSVQRTVVAYDKTVHKEAQVTDASGVCDPGAPECVRIKTPMLHETYQEVRQQVLGGFRYRDAAVSPHYGFRTVMVVWTGGRC